MPNFQYQIGGPSPLPVSEPTRIDSYGILKIWAHSERIDCYDWETDIG